jgi:hypothetical protein
VRVPSLCDGKYRRWDTTICCFSPQSEHHAGVLQGHHMRHLQGSPGMRT